MDRGIRGRVAFVGASSKGLGLSAAESLAAEGVNLAMCARGEEALGAAAQRIRGRFGVEVLGQALDVTDFEAITKFMNETRNRRASVCIRVTGAAEPPGGAFEVFSLEDRRKGLRVELSEHPAHDWRSGARNAQSAFSDRWLRSFARRKPATSRARAFPLMADK